MASMKQAAHKLSGQCQWFPLVGGAGFPKGSLLQTPGSGSSSASRSFTCCPQSLPSCTAWASCHIHSMQAENSCERLLSGIASEDWPVGQGFTLSSWLDVSVHMLLCILNCADLYLSHVSMTCLTVFAAVLISKHWSTTKQRFCFT